MAQDRREQAVQAIVEEIRRTPLGKGLEAGMRLVDDEMPPDEWWHDVGVLALEGMLKFLEKQRLVVAEVINESFDSPFRARPW